MSEPSFRPQINPALYAWARSTRGFSRPEAAKRIGVSPDRLREWESGTAHPTIGQLRTLANVYKRPLAAFFLPEPPIDADARPEFRVTPGGSESESPELRLAIRYASMRQDAAAEMMAALGRPAPGLARGLSTQSAPDPASAHVRSLLGVSVDEQASSDQYHSFSVWRRAIEAQGVLVFQYGDVEVSEARGFSLDHETAPLIALNVTDSPRARAFTIIHELTHILVGANGICTPHEADYSGKSRTIEQFCDGVAASTLIPSSSFVAQAEVANHDEGAAWSDATIARLSHRYGVSRLVIAMRLNGLRLMSDGELGAKLKLYNQPWKPKGGMVPQPTKILANMGRSFTRLVLDSYNASVITAPELARVLGIKINNLAALVSALEEGGG